MYKNDNSESLQELSLKRAIALVGGIRTPSKGTLSGCCCSELYEQTIHDRQPGMV